MTLTALALALLASATPASSATPNSHLWVVNELFSSPDGVVQFIEMRECCGSTIEIFTDGLSLYSDATGQQFTLDHNLSGNSAHRSLLFGTAAFAALPGAPTPDFILPDHFFSVTGDTIRWHIYTNATLTFANGQLPIDGQNSLNRGLGPRPNSPTNFAGQSGSVNILGVPALRGRWLVPLAGLVLVSGLLALRRLRAA